MDRLQTPVLPSFDLLLLRHVGNGSAWATRPSQLPASTSPSRRKDAIPVDPNDSGSPWASHTAHPWVLEQVLWTRESHFGQLNLTEWLLAPSFSDTIQGCVSSLRKKTLYQLKLQARWVSIFQYGLKKETLHVSMVTYYGSVFHLRSSFLTYLWFLIGPEETLRSNQNQFGLQEILRPSLQGHLIALAM